MVITVNGKRPPKAQGPARAPDRGQSTPSSRILVVDDEPLVRQLTTEVLSHFGYQVDAAEDGAAAWDTLQGNTYDLLITDNNMPRMSGVELLKRLYVARMALPVILVSGAMPTEELNRYPWLPLAATLLKPFTADQLLRSVQGAMRKAGNAQEEIKPLQSCPC